MIEKTFRRAYRVASIEPSFCERLSSKGTADEIFVLAPEADFQVRVDGDLVGQGRRTFSVDEAQVDHPPETSNRRHGND